MLSSIIKTHENTKKLMSGLITRKEAVVSFIPTPEEQKVMFKDRNYMYLVRQAHWNWYLFHLSADQELEKDFPWDGSENNKNRVYLIPGYSLSFNTIETMGKVRDRLWPGLDLKLVFDAMEDSDSFSLARITLTVGEWLSILNTDSGDPDTIFGISEEMYASLDQAFLDQVFE